MLHIVNRWALSLLELLAFFPLILVITIVLNPPMNLYLYLISLSVSYLIGIIWGKVVNLTHRNFILILGFIAIGFGLYRLFGVTLELILLSLIYLAVYFRGFKSSESSDPEWFPLQIFFISYLLHFAIIFYFSRVYELNHYLPYLAWSAFLTIIVSLVFMNFNQLKHAALSNNSDFSPPTGMVRKNFLMVALVLIMLFSISYFRTIRESVLWLWTIVINTIFSILAFISALLQGDQAQQALPAQENQLIPALEDSTRPANPIWLAIMEFISTILLSALILAIVFLLIKAIYSLLRTIFRSLFQYEKNGSHDNGEEDQGFVDQKENLFDLSKLKENYLRRFQTLIDSFLKREKRWQDLSGNMEKIRFLYKYAIIKYVAAGYKFKSHLTPNELAKDALRWRNATDADMIEIADLYSATRYGDKDAGDMKVNEMKERIIDQQDI